MTIEDRDELIRLAGQLSDDLAVHLRSLAELTADAARLAACAKQLRRLAIETDCEPMIELELTTERTENTERTG